MSSTKTKSCLLRKGKAVNLQKIKRTTTKTYQFDETTIDFNSTDPNPQACFTLGSDFPNLKVQLEITSQQAGGSTTSSSTTTTDSNGEFCQSIPQNTTSLTATVTYTIPNNAKLKCMSCCQANSLKCSCYIEQTDTKITSTKEFSPYVYDLIWRSYDGSANNLSSPTQGAVNDVLLRKSAPVYTDGSSTLAIRNSTLPNPNPRTISNTICKQTTTIPSPNNLTDMVWAWGQFLDHELDLTPDTSGESADIITPTVAADPEEDYPERTISFHRSGFIPSTDPREHPNHISAFIDATNVYGYQRERAYALRRLDGTGKLKTLTADNGETILPYNNLTTPALDNAAPSGSTASDFFISGDIRANENVLLTSLHTLFVREHNRLCDQIAIDFPVWDGQDELIYQHARRIVSGQMAQITYSEFLPALLGPTAIPQYINYNSSINPQIFTEFSTAGYRLGHSMLSSNLLTADPSNPATTTTLALRDAFFQPAYVQTNGIDALLQGAFLQIQQKIDNHIVDDVRNFLFGPPTATHLLDLAALNIQRGRDHGLPDYNTVRQAFGLTAKSTFAQITSTPSLQTALASLYDSPDHIDPWVGAICEDHVPNAEVGELIYTILREQFLNLRDGDRFYFLNDPALSPAEKADIQNTTLADIIRRNTAIIPTNIPDDVFHLTP